MMEGLGLQSLVPGLSGFGEEKTHKEVRSWQGLAEEGGDLRTEQREMSPNSEQGNIVR